MAIPNFFQSFCTKMFSINSECAFLAILNLYQSFWEKLSEKILNDHFWPFQIYTSLFGKNCQKIFRMAIFGHSKFIPVFLGKIVRKNSEWPFLAIPNLYQSFGQNCGKNLEWPFLAILNFFSLFGKICQKKFGMAFFGHSKFKPVFLSEKIWNSHFWPFQSDTSLSGGNLECPFLAILNFSSHFGKSCKKKFGMTILAIPNLYQSFW